MTDKISTAEQALIQRHIATKGVTHCPQGAMATASQYVYVETGGVGGTAKLKRADGKSGKDQYNSGSGQWSKNKARGERLRKAEAR